MTDLLLTTARLDLRPIAEADRSALHALWNDPAVGEYLWDGEPVSRAVVDGVIAATTASFADHGWGIWGLRPSGADDLIGFCGFHPFHEPPVVELLFGLAPAAWGKRFAFEAAEAAIAYARDQLGWETIHASNDPPNRRSTVLLERLGFRFVRRAIRSGQPTDHYALGGSSRRASGR